MTNAIIAGGQCDLQTCFAHSALPSLAIDLEPESPHDRGHLSHAQKKPPATGCGHGEESFANRLFIVIVIIIIIFNGRSP